MQSDVNNMLYDQQKYNEYGPGTVDEIIRSSKSVTLRIDDNSTMQSDVNNILYDHNNQQKYNEYGPGTVDEIIVRSSMDACVIFFAFSLCTPDTSYQKV